MSALVEQANDYLQLRHALGHKLNEAHRLLPSFITYLDAIGAETVTVEAALTWAQRRDADPASSVWIRRMAVARGFARHMAGVDPNTEIPPFGLVTFRQRWHPPFIYSKADITALMAYAHKTIPSPLRAATVETLIGLLAATGMRVGEAIRLEGADVDRVEQVVVVRNSKFGKSRLVPLRTSTIDALEAYVKKRDRLQPRPKSPTLFVSTVGTQLRYSDFCQTFRRLVDAAGVGIGAPYSPKIHDIRYPNLNKIPTLAPKRCDSCQVREKRLGFSFIVCSSLSIQRRAFPWTYKTYGITIPSFLPTWKTRATQNSTWHGSPGS